MFGITRAKKQRQWLITVKRHGQFHRKSFSDACCGGKVDALFAAQRYRDELLREHPPMTKRTWYTKVRCDNTSGVPGVCRSEAFGRLEDNILYLVRHVLAK